jgi:CheY-like chemotaxis protein
MTISAPPPVAFMVMPFRRKPVPNPPQGAPAEVDFDSLWDLAYQPALESLGYLLVRADSDAGSVIIKDMLERLAFADLVLADMTIPNGNVYYEVGIRHVAQQSNCVLISADWSQQLFDVQQMRSLRFPLKDTSITAATAAPIQQVLKDNLNRLKNEKTPFHALVSKPADSSVFRQQLQHLSDFQTDLRAVRLIADKTERQQRVRQLMQQPPRQPGDQGHRLRAAVAGARQPQLGGHPGLHRAAAGLGEGQSLQPRAGPAGPSQGR